MRPTLLLTLALIASPALPQVTSSVSASCSVRIRPLASADYNPASEFTLRGIVTHVQEGILKIRLPFGVIRVHVGRAFPKEAVAVGRTVEVVASKCQDEQGQRFIAREVRHPGGTVILRDTQGVPVSHQL